MSAGHATFSDLRGPALRPLQLVIDAVAVVSSMTAAAFVRPLLMGHVPGLKDAARFSDHALLAYLVLPVWLMLIVVVRLHDTFTQPLSQSDLLTRLVKLNVSGLLSLALLQFLTQAIVNRSLVALFLALSFAFMYVQRTVSYAWVRYQHARGHGRPCLLLVGRPSRRMYDFVASAKAAALPAEVLGYLQDPESNTSYSMPPPNAEALTKLGTLSALAECLEKHNVTEVVFLAPHQSPETVTDELSICEELGVPASFVVDVKQLSRASPRIRELYEHCVVSFDVAPKRPEALALKNGVDPLVALVGIVIAAPVMLAAAVAIACTMGFPITFTQQRAGRYGRPFRMFKFRTMVPDAELQRDALAGLNEVAGPAFKARSDPRITPLGRLLRRTSIDELPQLFNVLTGSMSLVGPRPLPVREHEQIHGWQRRRLSMKPGITGLWQISGRSNIDFDQWMLLDLKYIDDWSLWLDLQILLKTIPAVLFARGAR